MSMYVLRFKTKSKLQKWKAQSDIKSKDFRHDLYLILLFWNNEKARKVNRACTEQRHRIW